MSYPIESRATFSHVSFRSSLLHAMLRSYWPLIIPMLAEFNSHLSIRFAIVCIPRALVTLIR